MHDKMKWIGLIYITALIMTVGCRKDADLLLFNGSIYTVNNHSDIVSAMVILDGHVIATG